MTKTHIGCGLRLFLISLLFGPFSCETEPIKINFPEGGYPYLTSPADYAHFYYAPAKNLMSREDSINTAFYGYHFYNSFGEKNISLHPATKSIFRFAYGDGTRTVPEVIITLTEDRIQIKKTKSGNPDPILVDSVLTDKERYYLDLMRSYNLFSRGKHYSEKTNRRLDSILNKNPLLADSRYHVFLLNKCMKKLNGFSYTMTSRHITPSTFKRIVDSINTSGFWKLPFRVDCPYPPMDGDGFCLEASTPQNYNIVCASSCSSSAAKFVRACRELVKEAGLTRELRF